MATMTENEQQSVSIIIPVRNEERYIGACLDYVLAQDYPGIVQILVVDGMSTDRSREITSEFAKNDERVRLLDNPKIIQPAAMNIGLKAAASEIIVRMDAHAYYAPGYVSECVKALAETDADVVGGVFRIGGTTFWQKAIAFGLMSPIGVGTVARRDTEPAYADTVSFGAYRRELAERLGGYNEELPRHEDVEFFARVRQSGGKILRIPDIRFVYYPRGSLTGLWHQNYVTGRWTFTALRVNKGSVSRRQLVPGLFVAVLLCFAASAAFIPFARWALLAILLCYALLIMSGSVDIGLRRGWQYAAVMPAIYLFLHFGYGLGTLVGAVRAGNPPTRQLENASS